MNNEKKYREWLKKRRQVKSGLVQPSGGEPPLDYDKVLELERREAALAFLKRTEALAKIGSTPEFQIGIYLDYAERVSSIGFNAILKVKESFLQGNTLSLTEETTAKLNILKEAIEQIEKIKGDISKDFTKMEKEMTFDYCHPSIVGAMSTINFYHVALLKLQIEILSEVKQVK